MSATIIQFDVRNAHEEARKLAESARFRRPNVQEGPAQSDDWTQSQVHDDAPERGPQLMALVAGIVVLAIVIIVRFYR